MNPTLFSGFLPAKDVRGMGAPGHPQASPLLRQSSGAPCLQQAVPILPQDAAAFSWSGVKAAISCSSSPINNSWSPIKPTGEMVCYWKTMQHH